MIASLELSLNIAKYIKYKIKNSESVTATTNQTGEPIPITWDQGFHFGVGHSHQISEFKKNVNTSELSFDNISVTELFQKDNEFSSQFKVLILGGSTTDPLGTQFSGHRGTWVHHLFDSISQNNSSRYIIDNAGNGGSTSSNELLRLITKFHSNSYDLVISYNGINEIYFYWNSYLRNKENVLASNMVLNGINDFGVLKVIGGKTLTTGLTTNLLQYFRKSLTYEQLNKIKENLSSRATKSNSNFSNKEISTYYLSNEEKDMLSYGAGVWEKNIELMHSASLAMNSQYLVVLQPTLGLNNDYCKIVNEYCLISDRKDYLARIRYLYSILREICSTKKYCLDISNDYALTTDDSLYSDGRHPNSEGNKRVAEQIRESVKQLLSM